MPVNDGCDVVCARCIVVLDLMPATGAVLASPERVAALVLIGSESGVFTDEEKVGFSEWVSQSQATPLNVEVRFGVVKMLFGASTVS